MPLLDLLGDRKQPFVFVFIHATSYRTGLLRGSGKRSCERHVASCCSRGMLFHVGSFDYHAMASTDNESLLQLSLCREGCGCLDILPIALALILRQVTEVW